VCFEQLERDPLGEIRRIYGTLSLDSYQQAKPAVEAYVASQRSYRKNDLQISASDRERIAQRWAFAFTELGYGTEAGV
jgi:omega-hydroxy-beta-dihydromenaquinone-9 sulfotransferase